MIRRGTQTNTGTGGLPGKIGVIGSDRESGAPRDANSRADLRVPDPGLGGNGLSDSKLFNTRLSGQGLGCAKVFDSRLGGGCLGLWYENTRLTRDRYGVVEHLNPCLPCDCFCRSRLLDTRFGLNLLSIQVANLRFGGRGLFLGRVVYSRFSGNGLVNSIFNSRCNVEELIFS